VKPGSMPRTRRRKTAVAGSAIACAVVVGLFVPTAIGGWAPLVHWTCASGGTLASEVLWIPAILVNAPYGGYVAGNATLPPGLIGNGGGLGSSQGLPASNGSVGGLFFHVVADVSENGNVTVWGSGPNVRCDQEYAVSISLYFGSSSGEVYSAILGNTGNRSDVGEPNMYNLTPAAGDKTASFENGFETANVANISTCNAAQEWQWVLSSGLDVRLNVTIDQQLTPVFVFLPFPQAYHYYFPANFGTWQIDNLSVPDGPGGGWAFSYSPCP
jgi:hypothetical protein